MKTMKKMCIVFSMCLAAAGVQPGIVSAAELPEDEAENVVDEQVEYDLELGGVQTFEMIDEDGEEEEIIVEEMPGTARVAKGTYKIKRTKKGFWSAGFYVDISSNKFVKVYDKFFSTTKGSISNTKLTKNSDTRATLKFSYIYGSVSKAVSLKAEIINKKLIISIV